MDSAFPALYAANPHTPNAHLPIAQFRDNVLFTIERFPVTILVGETGSGKTTQLPQFLRQAGWCSAGEKIIAVTQPRRVAATTVASRVAEEVGVRLGEDVGYSIRFEDLTSAKTSIKFMTDGLILREALVDPLLSRYSVIMVDEAHERSLSTDILLGILKRILRRRPDLRIVISSATMLSEEFLDFFSDDETRLDIANNALHPIGKILSIEGRSYPVDVLYLKQPVNDYLERAVNIVLDIHCQETPGDILVFLPGREDIEMAIQMTSENAASLPVDSHSILSLPLYAGLSREEQLYVFERAPEDTRKVIFSTNVAEASITVEGIVYVVDCGLAKLRAYNPDSGIETLTCVPISRAAATQRAGRAGRTKPGKCFRIYTEESFLAFNEATTPEVQRCDLCPAILQLKALGIDNILRFDFISRPPSRLLSKAMELLYSLEALDSSSKLTKPLGMQMAELPLGPMMARALLKANSFGCLDEVLTIAAMMSLQSSFWVEHDADKTAVVASKRKFAVEEGDHLTSLNVFRAFDSQGSRNTQWCRANSLSQRSLQRAATIRTQLRRSLERLGVAMLGSTNSATRNTCHAQMSVQIRRCLATGFFAQAARMRPDGSFATVNGVQILHAHPSSLMFNRKADWVIFNEIMETGDKIFIKDITKIERAWLLEFAPEFYKVSQ